MHAIPPSHEGDGPLAQSPWGVNRPGRGRAVATTLEKNGIQLFVIDTTRLGRPKHPLYLKGDLQPRPFDVRRMR